MLMARLARSAALRCTRSLSTAAPGGTVIDEWPLNVSTRSVPDLIAAPPAEIATCAAPISSGWVPNSFVSRTRNRSPPTLIRTISRTVWLVKLGALPKAVTGCCGLAPQVPTQCGSPRSRNSSPARAGPNVAAANVIAIAARPAAKRLRRLRAKSDDLRPEATPLRGALLMRIVHPSLWIFNRTNQHYLVRRDTIVPSASDQ